VSVDTPLSLSTGQSTPPASTSTTTPRRQSTTRNLRGWMYGAPLLLVYLIFLLVPFLQLVQNSLHPFGGGHSYTVANYRQFFTEAFYLKALLKTFVIAACVTALGLVLAYPLAYFLYGSRHGRHLVMLIVLAPVFTSGITRIYGWTLILVSHTGLLSHVPGVQNAHLLFTPTAVVIGLASLLLPITLLPIYGNLVAIDPAVFTAARGLGASRTRTIRTVLLPLTRTGLVSSAAIVFIISSTSVGATVLLGGPQVTTIPNFIYEQYFTTFNYQFASAMAIILIVCIAVIATILLRLARPQQPKAVKP
jgi:putative spermidine/putrescine transport system permease protein